MAFGFPLAFGEEGEEEEAAGGREGGRGAAGEGAAFVGEC